MGPLNLMYLALPLAFLLLLPWIICIFCQAVQPNNRICMSKIGNMFPIDDSVCCFSYWTHWSHFFSDRMWQHHLSRCVCVFILCSHATGRCCTVHDLCARPLAAAACHRTFNTPVSMQPDRHADGQTDRQSWNQLYFGQNRQRCGFHCWIIQDGRRGNTVPVRRDAVVKKCFNPALFCNLMFVLVFREKQKADDIDSTQNTSKREGTWLSLFHSFSHTHTHTELCKPKHREMFKEADKVDCFLKSFFKKCRNDPLGTKLFCLLGFSTHIQ